MFVVIVDMNFERVKGKRNWRPLLDDREHMEQFPSVEWLKSWKTHHQFKDFEWLVIDMNTLDMNAI